MIMRYFLALAFILISQNSLLASKCCCKKVPQCCCQNAKPGCCKKAQPSWWKTGWATTVFSGPLTSQITTKMFSNADFSKSGIVAIAVSKKLGSVWDKRLDFELEAVAVQHFGEQTNFEIDPISIVARWNSFPWNDTIATTFAIGDGLSIATSVPKLEKRVRGSKSAKVLNYVMAELTFSLPAYPNWALVGRYHHRSGAFGLINGVHDASTAFAAGFKYWF